MRTAITRVLAFVNVSSIGLIVDDENELADESYADGEALADTIRSNREHCVGVKIRASERVLRVVGREALTLAVDVAEATGTRVMVHITQAGVPLEEILAVAGRAVW